MRKKAIIILSGGLDSTTILAIAKSQDFDIFAITFNYGQKHAIEVEFAKKITQKEKVTEHKIITIDSTLFLGSSLTSKEMAIPKNKYDENSKHIPNTYVPVRNLLFLSYAAAYGESINAFDIFIGVNAIDYSGYPDCRPEFINSFTQSANLASAKSISSDKNFTIHTPLINLSKVDIIKKGLSLGVDYSLTISCYDPIIKNDIVLNCNECDSCLIRKKAFDQINKV